MSTDLNTLHDMLDALSARVNTLEKQLEGRTILSGPFRIECVGQPDKIVEAILSGASKFIRIEYLPTSQPAGTISGGNAEPAPIEKRCKSCRFDDDEAGCYARRRIAVSTQEPGPYSCWIEK